MGVLEGNKEFFAQFSRKKVCWTVNNIKFDVLNDWWDENRSMKWILSLWGRKLMNIDYWCVNQLFLNMEVYFSF
jgi:hypothetical protein